MILNVPFTIFSLTAILAKSLSIVFAKTLYHLGIVLTPSLATLIAFLEQIPVIALTNFQRPALIGALVIGPVIGASLGILLAVIVLVLRRTLLTYEKRPKSPTARLQKISAQFFTWSLFGNNIKTNFLRTFGVLATIIVVAILLVGWEYSFSIQNGMIHSLTRLNGATVDIGTFNISPLSGSFQLTALGVTNRNKPTRNVFQAELLEANADLYHLLIGQAVVENITATGVKLNSPRVTPGQVVKQPTPPITTDRSQLPIDWGKLEDYLAKAEKLKRWLEKIYAWLPHAKKSPPIPPPAPQQIDYLTLVHPTKDHYRFLLKKASLGKVKLDSK
ncbi:hypothetical protein TI03_05575, partial [Achromatium sp. WMS1]